jgi:hypothetical protein
LFIIQINLTSQARGRIVSSLAGHEREHRLQVHQNKSIGIKKLITFGAHQILEITHYESSIIKRKKRHHYRCTR